VKFWAKKWWKLPYLQTVCEKSVSA